MFLNRILFAILLSGFTAVLCADKEPCDFSDEDCVTNGDKPLFKLAVAGNDSLGIEKLDPMPMKTIIIHLPHDMNYVLENGYIYGLNDCDGRKLRFTTDLSFYFYLVCPKLTLIADYVETSVVDSVPIEGKGKIVITYDNAHIETEGQLETLTGSDGKPHVNIKNHKVVHIDVKDNVNFNFTNLLSTDNEKSEKAHNHINDNWKDNTGEIHYPILQPFMARFLDNKNIVLALVPMNELFYRNP